jgi:zinc protease
MRNSYRSVCSAAVFTIAACGGSSKPGTLPVTAPTAIVASDPVIAPVAPTPAVAPAHAQAVRSLDGIDEYVLTNGLRVLLFADPTQSTVTVNVTYLVGSMHEGAGETGMAHLLEHMMFKGSPKHRNVLKLLDERGAFANGSTWQDRTNYYETLPATGDNLRWTLELEADRMVHASISDDDLATEFSVVRNEMESGENNPRSILEQRVTAAAYQWHNYGKDTIGSRSDVESVPTPRLRAFYDKYYQPDNAVLIIAGKFETAAALADIEATFAGLPRPTRTLPATYTVEPVQDGERTVTLRRTGDVNLLMALYHSVAGAHPDHVAFDALADVLTREPTGRLYQRLVAAGLAADVSAYQYLFRDPSYVVITAKAKDAKTVERMRAALLATIEGFAKEPVTSVELERFRASAMKEYQLGLADSSRIAIELSEWAAAGDWRLLFAYRDRLKAITAADVQRVAMAYLKASNRTLGQFIPTASPDRAPVADNPDVAAIVGAVKPTVAEVGEVFESSLDNLAARTVSADVGGIRASYLAKKTRGGKVILTLTLRHGDVSTLGGKTVVAGLVADLAVRGTKTRSYSDIEDTKDRLTANLSLSSDAGSIRIRIETVRASLPEMVTLVADILKHPALSAKEFEVVKNEAISGLEEQLQDPSQLAFVRFTQLLSPWPKSDPRASLTLAEQIATLRAMTVANVQAYYRAFWGAGHGELAVVGDVDVDALSAQIARELGGWTSAAPYARLPDKAFSPPASSETIDTKDKEMAIILAGHEIALDDKSPDAAAVRIASQILGGSTGSRLWMRLREHDGYSYGVWGGFSVGDLDPVGRVSVGAILAPQNLAAAKRAFSEEIERLITDGVTAAEVDVARTGLLDSESNFLSDDGTLVSMLANDRYLGRDFGWWRERRAALATVTAVEVNRALKTYLVPDRLIWIEAGDLAKAK